MREVALLLGRSRGVPQKALETCVYLPAVLARARLGSLVHLRMPDRRMTTEQRFAELTGLLKPILGDAVTPEVRELARLVQLSIRQDAGTIDRLQKEYDAACRKLRYSAREARLAEELVEEVRTETGVEMDDPRISYVTLQMTRSTWKKVSGQ